PTTSIAKLATFNLRKAASAQETARARLSAVAVAIWISTLSACPRWFLIEPQATLAPVKARKSHQIAAKAGAFDGSNNVRFGPIADIRQCKRHVRFLAFGWGTHVFNQRGALSQTHASCANHSCSVRQKGQCERLKNTGVARKRARLASYPVEISRPVFGQRIITVPIVALFGQCPPSEVPAPS